MVEHGTDVAARVRAFNASREAERMAIKYAKMRQDPFIFLRGACHLFYGDWPEQAVLPKAPWVWICGDLHLENFGSYLGDNRLTYFDLNDFDEACLAPCVFDPLRAVTSLMLAGHGLGAGAAEVRMLSRDYLAAYAAELAAGKPRWLERSTSVGLVRRLLRGLKRRDQARFLDARSRVTRHGRRFRIDGIRSLAATPEQAAAVRALIERVAADLGQPGALQVVDVARRIAGTGSLGLQRYAVLVQGDGTPEGNLLLDLKEAAPAAVTGQKRSRKAPWRDEAQRVVTLQHLLQAISPAFLYAVRWEDRGFILRELQPMEDRVDLAAAGGRLKSLQREMVSFARLTAWAHLRGAGRMGADPVERLLGFGADPSWREPLLDLAHERCQRTLDQWRAFSRAYDAGYFTL